MYLRPGTLSEACEALAAHPLRILAGGTDFYPSLGDGPAPPAILDVTALPELEGVSLGEDTIRIGARTTWTQLRAAELPPGFDALKGAAREVGSVQIQNVATIGGNLCNASPAADGVPPLLCLDAAVELASAAGRRRMPLATFLRGVRSTERRQDEILTAVIVPRRAASGRSVFAKLGGRRYLVISVVSTAVRLVADEEGRIAEAAVAVGSCSVAARRLPALEAALVGRPVEAALASVVEPAHLAPLSPIDDVRGSAAYRLDAAAALVGRALAACGACP